MNPRGRNGFTLGELVISLTLLAVTGGAIARAIVTQWRQHDALAESAHIRRALTEGADLLSAELRALSPAAGDLVAISDTGLEVRGTLGASVVCSADTTNGRIVLPPRHPSSGSPLTWWRDAPRTGDSVEVLDGRGGAPDTVTRHMVTAIGSGNCPMASGFARSVADQASGIEFAVSPPPSPSAGAGSPVRFLRPVRYSLYKSSSDNRWYVGIRELVGGSWSGVQPVTGPYRPAAGVTGGLAFVVRDSTWSHLTSAVSSVRARAIEIVLRGLGTQHQRTAGRSAPFADSLSIVLTPRNR